jgi:hypothetical protein
MTPEWTHLTEDDWWLEHETNGLYFSCYAEKHYPKYPIKSNTYCMAKISVYELDPRRAFPGTESRIIYSEVSCDSIEEAKEIVERGIQSLIKNYDSKIGRLARR